MATTKGKDSTMATTKGKDSTMATTKGKDSTLVKKRGESPSNSLPSQDKRNISSKQTKPAYSDSKDSTTSKKTVPNYLKPTFSSHNEPPKPTKKNGPDDSTQKPNLMRRRSFDRPPSVSQVQNAHISPGPREKNITRSSTFTGKTNNVPKPVLDKNSRTSTRGATMQHVQAKTVKNFRVKSKKEDNGPVTENISSGQNPDSTQTPPAIESKIEDKESAIKLGEEEAEVITSESEERANSVCTDTENSELEEVVAPTEVDRVSESPTPNDVANEEGVEGETEEIKNEVEERENDGSKDVSSDIQLEEDSREEAIVQGTEDKTADITECPEDGNETVITSKEVEDGNKAEANAEDEREDVEPQETQQANVVVEEKKPEAPDVISKHKGGQGKKDSQAYNDIIEETTSKLMEKRKNKVRALVGAFETVIDYESAK